MPPDGQEATDQKPSGLARIVLNFTPSWFVVNMGTGISSILLHQLPYQFKGLHIIGNIVWGLNVVLFLLFLSVSLARYIIWPRMWWVMLFHPTQSLFLGCFSMGFATIVNMCVFSGVPAWGSKFATFTWVLWWIDAVVSIVVCIGVPFVQMTRHDQALDKVTGVWFLPVVATIVSAASGGVVAAVLPPAHARLTIIISYILFGTGFSLAIMLMALYIGRLFFYKIPPATILISSLNPLGPCGQGAFCILKLSSVIYKLAQETGHGLEGSSAVSLADGRIIATAIYGATIPIALVIWGIGLVWLVISVASFIDVSSVAKVPFNIGWWSLTFPLGVFCTATTQLASELDSGAFKILGTALSLLEVLLWLCVFTGTVVSLSKGKLIYSPCLAEIGGKPPAEMLPSRKYAYEAKDSKSLV